MNKETMIAIPADPNDPDDFDVSVAGLERGLMGRKIRKLRNRLGWRPKLSFRDLVKLMVEHRIEAIRSGR